MYCEVRQINARSDSAKAAFAYLHTSGRSRFPSSLFVKLSTLWDNYVTAGNSHEQGFRQYLSVNVSHCNGC
jgi:hypothetical protein